MPMDWDPGQSGADLCHRAQHVDHHPPCQLTPHDPRAQYYITRLARIGIPPISSTLIGLKECLHSLLAVVVWSRCGQLQGRGGSTPQHAALSLAILIRGVQSETTLQGEGPTPLPDPSAVVFHLSMTSHMVEGGEGGY